MKQKWTRKNGKWIVEYIEQNLTSETISKPLKSKKLEMFKKQASKPDSEQIKKPVGRPRIHPIKPPTVKEKPSIVISESRRSVKRDRIRESMGLPKFEE